MFYACIRMYTLLYACIRMYTHAYACIRMYTHVYKTSILRRIAKFFYLLPTCILKYFVDFLNIPIWPSRSDGDREHYMYT